MSEYRAIIAHALSVAPMTILVLQILGARKFRGRIRAHSRAGVRGGGSARLFGHFRFDLLLLVLCHLFQIAHLVFEHTVCGRWKEKKRQMRNG